jgi:hypothetical protein
MDVLADGKYVELTGIAHLTGDPLVSPLTGEPCLAHVCAARVFTRLDHLGDLIDELKLYEIAPFVLATSNAAVHVVERPTIVDIDPLPLIWPPHDRAAEFLARRRLATYVRSTFFEHAVINDGDELTVSGIVTREADPAVESGFRELQVRIRLTGYGKYPLTIRRARR